jgi:hypothetical protein
MLVSRLFSLIKPVDFDYKLAFIDRLLIDKARNGLAKAAVQHGDDYIFFVDDDTIPPPDAIVKMLELNKDIVAPPIPDRHGEGKLCLFEDDLSNIKEFKETRRVGACGMASTLIKRKVLEAMFKKYSTPFDFEVLNINNVMTELSEDVNFCKRAKELGFETWGIASVHPQHLGGQIIYQYNP